MMVLMFVGCRPIPFVSHLPPPLGAKICDASLLIMRAMEANCSLL